MARIDPRCGPIAYLNLCARQHAAARGDETVSSR